jgi:2-methylcitrate dehydratase
MSTRASASADCAAAHPALRAVADYAAQNVVPPEAAVNAAYVCLLDALGGGFEALRQPACARLLGPLVPGATMSYGARVPGTSYELDPVMGAFNVGVMMRWVEHGNPAPTAASAAGPPGLAAQHLGAILALGDFLARRAHCDGRGPLVVRDLLIALIKAHEIQAMLARVRSQGEAGCVEPGRQRHDHIHDQIHEHIRVDDAQFGIVPFGIVPFGLVAAAAVAANMLGARRDQIMLAVAEAANEGGGRPGHSCPGQARSAVACGDTAGRAVRLALRALVQGSDQPPAPAASAWEIHQPSLLGERFLQGAGRRAATPDAMAGFAASAAAHFGARQAAKIQARFADAAHMLGLPVNECMALLVRNG